MGGHSASWNARLISNRLSNNTNAPCREVHGNDFDQFSDHRKGSSIGLLLLILLVLLIVGGLPSLGCSRSWGYGPSGLLGLVPVVVLVLVLRGTFPVTSDWR